MAASDRPVRRIESDDSAEVELAGALVPVETPAMAEIPEAQKPLDLAQQDRGEYAVGPEPPRLFSAEETAAATVPALIVSDLAPARSGLTTSPASSEETNLAAESPGFRLNVLETRLLRALENIYRVVPENSEVCDVLVFNPREVALIGRQQGSMQLDFWYDSQGLRRASYLVTVEGASKPAAQVYDESRKLEILLEYLFPGSRIECRREPDRLIVRGYAVSQRQAVDIVSMVRRSQLIPVVDQIEIRTRDQ